MTYPVGGDDRGWLWEHKFSAAAVCLGVLAASAALLDTGVVPPPLRLVLVGADFVSALVLTALLLLWLSTTASNVSHDAEPSI